MLTWTASTRIKLAPPPFRQQQQQQVTMSQQPETPQPVYGIKSFVSTESGAEVVVDFPEEVRQTAAMLRRMITVAERFSMDIQEFTVDDNLLSLHLENTAARAQPLEAADVLAFLDAALA